MVDSRIQELYEKLIFWENIGDLFKDKTLASTYDDNFLQISGMDLGQYRANIDFLLDLTSYSLRDTVVDLGCGTGISTLRILDRNPGRVIGVDFSEPMLRQARKKLRGRDNVEFMAASAEELSDVVSEADKVVSANVFQYISDPNKALQSIHRTLSRDGEYLFNVKLKAPKDQSIFSQMFRVLEYVFGEEFGREVKFPELKGLEPKYDRKGIEDIVHRNGFVVQRYKERPIVYNEQHLRATHELSLTAMGKELGKIIGQERTQNIIQKARESLSRFYTADGFIAGKEAYVLLKKAA